MKLRTRTASLPNKSLLALGPLLKSLPASTEELKIARLSELEVSAHVGMVAGGCKCEAALVLTAATEKSEFRKFGDIYRLTTKNMLDVGFGRSGLKLKASECAADTESKVDMVSICTEQNLTD